MTDAHLREEAIGSEVLLDGNFLHARRDTVRLPDGASATREYVVHPGAVVVIPMLDDGRIVLERQYRYPIGQVMIEFPAGKLDAGEAPLVCGQRELLEETGYTAIEWAHAGAMHLAVAYSTEIIHIYFARGLSLGERQLDHGEFLDVFTATPAELLSWCRDGTLTDAKTLTCALWLQNVLSGAWTLDWQMATHAAANR
ncbi:MULTISPECIES: NUDIX hydrolase [unclassified Variovorax]|jgi:ADP-ribose pyrophosphatase|uniref:NUDIX hydrolase n=1 Tax=unclassified Variovorax TaxID=663243 RepID=UPI002B23B307|nr:MULTISPECIES: NUDIX hydrolase [unclassified Variovorax]MEB0056854.1 NUDIX hydrolase [Variovorax sp. LG9.2]MEB0112560.1 NUDIX hydrolase [Variovorax sp. RTB1]